MDTSGKPGPTKDSNTVYVMAIREELKLAMLISDDARNITFFPGMVGCELPAVEDAAWNFENWSLDEPTRRKA